MTGAPLKCEKDIPQFQKGKEFARIQSLLEKAVKQTSTSSPAEGVFSLETQAQEWLSQSYSQQPLWQKERILSLQKKYAVFQRLFSEYHPNHRKATETELSLQGYSLLGLCFLQWFEETNNFNFVNTSLKIWENLQTQNKEHSAFTGFSQRLQNLLQGLQHG